RAATAARAAATARAATHTFARQLPGKHPGCRSASTDFGRDNSEINNCICCCQVANGMQRIALPQESPLAVLVCAGGVFLPKLMELVQLTAVAASALPHDVGGSNSGSSHGGRGLPIYGCLICGESRCACAAKGSRLPLELDLGPRLQFHSCITCAVSKEEATQTNPAKLLSCGHVVCA
ncbi:uncharacterized protein LOC34623010, partial [Cyclospora cayetanensis]|uniref:Uncharacterized protein LOC34623010 n=1 Tax=Cyclospora cayetanensis TaxID=88456 RepID=A0A6P6RUZ8_9EIME